MFGQYPLYFGKTAEHRQKQRGTITIRFRKETFDLRKALVVGMKPPPMTYVSVAKKNDFAVAHYTTEGGTSMNMCRDEIPLSFYIVSTVFGRKTQMRMRKPIRFRL